MDSESLQQRETKAKNLLSSIVALAFADVDGADTDAAIFSAEAHQIQAMLTEQHVFRFVFAGNAYTKFFNHLITMSKNSAVYKQVAALEYLAVVVDGSAVEHLEARVPKILDVVFHALKHQHSSVCAPALRIFAALLTNADEASTDGRRAIVDYVARIVPVVLQHLHDVPLTAETTTYFAASYDALLAGLTYHSTTFRSFSTKVEQACLLILNPPMDLALARLVLPSAARCLGAVANATAVDATSAAWTQLVERSLLSLHYQLDLASGKDNSSESRNRPASLKNWVKDTTYPSLPLYLQAQRVAFKFEALGAFLEALLANGSVAEKDVSAIAPEILALLRRAFGVRADAVGKQSAVSEDGRMLPSSVLYGILASLQAPLYRVLTSLLRRGHLTLYRYASLLTKVVTLACHGAMPAAHDALHTTLQVVAKALGAGGYASTTAFVLQWVLSSTEALLAQANAKSGLQVQSSKALNAKKRRRDQLPLVTESTATSLPLTDKSRLSTQVNAALTTLAAILYAAGSWVATEDRVRIANLVAACLAESVLALSPDAVTLLGLANAVVVDGHGQRGIALAHCMQAWSSRRAGDARYLALSVGESILHPRAPPMAIDLTPATTNLHRQTGLSTKRLSEKLSNDMDWDDESAKDEDEDEAEAEAMDDAVEDEEEDDVDDEKDPAMKRQKVDDEDVADVNIEEVPEEAPEDATPEVEAVPVPVADDDEEFDFPDIVDED
ncbi:hypothetical protein SDRG_00618 [Saprolegnia diclina VS20]|uniref:Pre-rRNA-processing protein RIX1 N-terminal domain-containing protein n=1 Tax=Saprolegnia diclina (strain VS20) TaxID=1156394 RepID=T0R5R4_SAPDV|nr:hypothetical protein SDRG_00618 [Saprolegnia diclina VS20]EQC41755.1 hypothetical protein SDRG_00618 [Saprolegnia diclina VS20]|eukprot:XP_008604324.1 hypothetical protein SDRG_00618 [Saprolegnia diclina VS20]